MDHDRTPDRPKSQSYGTPENISSSISFSSSVNSPEPSVVEDQGATSSLHYSLLGPSLLKAGQDGVDQKKVSEIIYNASKGSKYFKHEEKRDEQLTQRINVILKRKRELEATSMSSEIRRADEQLTMLEKSRDLSQIIVHVDCDAFFASVEELDRPELKNVPMAVGRGVLSTCNYVARQFGVRSGMAGHIAKKVCPQLVFVGMNHEKYGAKAEEIRTVLRKYDKRFEAASVDEAFLNITKYLEDHPGFTPDNLVEKIRTEVLETTKISVSAGIGPNAKIAKIASNKNKPNGQFRIPNDRQAVMDFMHTLPVRKINGVGRVFERELEAVGIKTCGDIYEHRGILRQLFGDKALDFLLNCYLGIGRTEIRPAEEYERKSVGSERTFHDLSGAENLREKLRLTAETLEKDLKSAHCAGRVLVLKVKLHTYVVCTRQRNLGRPIYSKEDLYNFSLPLLQGLETGFPGLKIRLMGLRITSLVSTKKEAVDMQKWFFGDSGAASPQSSPKKRKPQQDDGWEVWPEEEFERVQEAEKEEEMKLTQELSEELEAKEQEYVVSGEEPLAEKSLAKKEASPPPVKPESSGWDCPICGIQQPAEYSVFNQHLDFCLSKGAIRNAVKESSTAAGKNQVLPTGPPRKKRLFRSKR